MAEVKEIEKVKEDLDEDEFDEEEVEEDEGGIFDDLLDDEDEGFEDLSDDTDEVVSDFSIADNILSSAPAVESWEGQNLEDTLSDRWIEKDWGSEDEAVTGSIYEAGAEDRGGVYGGVRDAYGSGRGGDGVYDAGGDVYAGKGEGGYEIQKDGEKGSPYIKEIKSESDARTRGSRSGLEIAGLKDEVAERRREARDISGLR